MEHPDPPAPALRAALIVDDHPLFRDALAMLLRPVSPAALIRTAGRLSDALQMIRGLQPDLVILDLALPDAVGTPGVARIRAALPDRPVLAIAPRDDADLDAAARAAGAAAVLSKQCPREAFAAVIGALASGRAIPVQPARGPVLSATATGPAPGGLAGLTPQQARILALICAGRLNKQIAHELSIAEATVKAHVTAIMRKLGVHSRTQAVLAAQAARAGRDLQAGRPG
ncbi:response regulator transcription factor [Mangrovicoccus algicola]|uniref:Response regulator transcription factor n=1 Tax=Mangrovicoccus algicola TaxID=2771008 RepID=A0A8J6YSX7_9RHOB|nr:response regulator transcription factor [Mangrovicoccus algicola]MBE3637015.1 response regulator transcription factor [Mangrovicoccus algicola]